MLRRGEGQRTLSVMAICLTHGDGVGGRGGWGGGGVSEAKRPGVGKVRTFYIHELVHMSL